MIFKAKKKILDGVESPPTAKEMQEARNFAAHSRAELRRYSLIARQLSSSVERQRIVVENNHLAPSFAAALGRKKP